MKKEKFYITTAITYTSQKPHFGNTYEVIMTDAIARYKRQRGYDVFFLTGTDEHGQKIEEKAKAAGVTPKEYVDNVSGEIRRIWDLMGASYDKFIRTTDDYHERAVQNIFKKLYDKGDIYKGVYEGWYCTPCESFFTDTQASDGKCPDCGRQLEPAKEEAYFFKMSKYADRLIKYIEDNPDFIQPEARKKEMINNFLKPGLQDLCVSRSSFKWGIPVPVDNGHVIYVWIDALSNYITALGYDPTNDVQPELFSKYWPADVHMIGKDIVRFHSIYWPIILMALDVELPKKVFGHPWFNFGSDKMSKSKGNVIYADDMASRFTVDGVRYYALSEMPYTNDGSITYEAVISRYNNDLANNLGNLVSRSIAMAKKYFDGVVPTPGSEDAIDVELKASAMDAVSAFKRHMDSYHLADAAEDVMAMLRRANKYIDETTPWVLAKSEDGVERLSTVIYNLLETIRIAAVLLTPFIPSSAKSIFDQIGTNEDEYSSIESFGALKPGTINGDGKILFSRIDEAKMLEEVNGEVAAARAAADALKEKDVKAAVAPDSHEISIDNFMDVDLRCAKVISCEKVQKSKKLLKLELDLGYETRTVVSGIAKFYQPSDLIGKKIIIVSNLKPATLCGVESHGMILASGEENVRVVFLGNDTPLGERIR